jgi:hypothetical protein
MFNVLSHKRNANQNYTESPSQPNQNGYHQENKQKAMLARTGGIRNLYPLLEGI